MKILTSWLQEFVDFDLRNAAELAQKLTDVGLAVELQTPVSDRVDDGAIFEMEIGTNRPDCMNHYGVAREAAAIYGIGLKAIKPALPPAHKSAAFPIEIEDKAGCARFTARAMRGAKIKDSPANIARRLSLLDQHPINNAVDATNYTLWEIGKPTHVFDLDLLEGGRIVVRRARAGETLRTLDGVERKLTPEDLVVADAKKPVGLAGTMGGYDTMITEKTRNILIESAWWDPVTVRKMSRRHGLHTDASHRFERGADFESTILSCDRAAELILQSGGGELTGDVIDVIARKIDQAPVELRLSEVHRILGPGLEASQVVRILQRLGFELIPEPGEEPEFTVHIPSWRLDVEREIDLIEEIARLHGYDKFPNTLPTYAGSVVELPNAEKNAKVRSSLLGLGYNEAVSLTFISHEDAERFSSVPVIELANPQSEEASVMRTSLVPGMLNMIAYNLNRGTENVRLFEAGSVFEASGRNAIELDRICVGAAGTAEPGSVHRPARTFSFFDLKGDIETLLHSFQHESLYFDTNAAEYYRPGHAARAVMDGATVAQFGQIEGEVAAARKFRQDIFIAELYLDRLYRCGLREVRFEALPRYPAVERDFSFIFADSVLWEKIEQAISNLEIAELRSLVPVEVFRGGAVPAGKHSILLRVMFQSKERTLRDDEVAQWSTQIIKALEGLGGTLRAS